MKWAKYIRRKLLKLTKEKIENPNRALRSKKIDL